MTPITTSTMNTGQQEPSARDLHLQTMLEESSANCSFDFSGRASSLNLTKEVSLRNQQLLLGESQPINNSNDFLKLDFANLPKLIGRSQERKTLNKILVQSLQNGAKTEIILVHGESGVGKSSLIETLQGKLQKSQVGYFVTGKYDQLKQCAKPYSAIVDAITDLCQQVVAKNDKNQHDRLLTTMQQDLLKVLGQETTVLINLIPSLSGLLAVPDTNDIDKKNNTTGKQPSSPPPSPSTASTTATGESDAKAATTAATTTATIDAIQNQQKITSSVKPSLKKFNTISSTSLGFDANPERAGFSSQVFVVLFRSFLKAFCKTSRPLVMFLDDLQWADEDSRKLIASISTDTSIENFLLVGSYRDNDTATFELDLEACKVNVTDVSLGPLSQDCVEEIVSFVTSVSKDQTSDLSAVILDKTGGNAYFCVQYLEALYREQLLFYDFGATRWNWNLKQIKRSTSVSNNIVDLLISKIQSLAKHLQAVLMYAACLGFTFDIHVLEGILRQEDSLSLSSTSNDLLRTTKLIVSLRESLQELTSEGLVHEFNEKKYQFSHDRVQQSAYALIPQGEEGDQLHLRIGRIILGFSNEPGAESWMLFRAVDLLVQQSHYLQGEEQKLELAHLNFRAAKEAMVQMAFLSAVDYVECAIRLLDFETMWEKHYNLCLELFTLQAKMHNACGNSAKCLEIVDIILEEARTIEGKLPAYYLRVIVHNGRGHTDLAIADAIKTLKKLGTIIPNNANKLHVVYEYIKTQRVLRGRTAQDLAWLPAMTDPIKIAKVRLLSRISLNAAEMEDLDLMFVAVIKMARMSIKYGVCSGSIFGLMTYGVLLGALGDLEGAYSYAPLGQELLKRPELQGGYPGGTHAACIYLSHLRKPLQDSIDPVLKGYQIGMELGDVEFSVMCLFDHVMLCSTIGMPLENLERQCQNYCGLLREFRQELVLAYTLPFYQFTLNLAGKSGNPLVLTGGAMNEVELMKTMKARNNLLAITNLRYVQMMTKYLFGAYDSADRDREYLAKNSQPDTIFVRYTLAMYAALTCIAMARKCPHKKKHYLKQVEPYVAKISKYVKSGSVNGVPMLKLVNAELLTFKPGTQSPNVKEAFNVAIRFARRSGFRILTGLGLERAGDYFYSTGDTSTAEDYLRDAYIAYEAFGASGKSKLLLEKYHWLKVDRSSLVSRTSVSKKMQAKMINSLKNRDLDLGRSLHSTDDGTSKRGSRSIAGSVSSDNNDSADFSSFDL